MDEGWRHRVEGLATIALDDELRVHEASRWGARRRGLAGLAAMPPDAALWIARCASVHTFGMRFALDLVWLDRRAGVVRIDRGVAPRRLRSCLRAASVIEVRAGHGERFAQAWRRHDLDRSSDVGGDKRDDGYTAPR